ncbi:histone H1-like [Coregonus clupeaformis]|uniref:histone H1-like n=1 Tax=Coregonus clupeaformis TaxID=59861 RepID=UPI001E1C7A52|nr:histone H1-like [Coregonus clupeaformis]
MAEVRTSTRRPARQRHPRRRQQPRPRKRDPASGELIVKAVTASRRGAGVSLAALKEDAGGRRLDVRRTTRVKIAVKSLVTQNPKVKKVAAKKPREEAKKVAAKKAVAAQEVPQEGQKPATPKKAAKSPKKVKKARSSVQEGSQEPQEGYKGSQAQSRRAQAPAKKAAPKKK